jgi:predicted acetyltransferase
VHRRYGYRGTRSDEEIEALGIALGSSFGFPPENARRWFELAGLDCVRVLLEGGRVVGGLVRVPMGQFFGGSRVPTMGIAGVGIDASARGTGAATAMMQREIRALHREGVALSTLHPATVPLYRRAGYEIAGGCHRAAAQARDLGGGRRALTVRRYQESDEDALRDLYRRFASRRDGWLDRGDYLWRRTRVRHDGQRAHGHVVLRGEAIEGYAFQQQNRTPDGYDIELTDLVYGSGEAASTLLAFLADHRSLAGEVTWTTAPDDAFLSLLSERHVRLGRYMPFMLRIVDAPRALAARGYPRHLRGRLDLALDDDVVADNRGRFVLSVEDGVGRVKPGGRGALKLDVRALAALYSGHHRASRLAEVSRLEGSASAIALADTLFAGPPPSVSDFF